MKIIYLYKKRIGVLILVLVLVGVLFSMQTILNNRLKNTALIHEGVSDLAEYNGLENSFKYKMPKEWNIQERSVSNDQVLYFADFKSNDDIIRGNVQVLNLNGDFKSLMLGKKNNGYKPPKFTDYNVTSLQIDKQDAFVVTYNQYVSKNNIFNVTEYFIDGKDKVYRFYFSVPSESYKENMTAVFKIIAENLNQN
jgi:hypothetical protein